MAQATKHPRIVCRYVGAQRGDSQLVRLSATPIGGSEAPPGGSPTFLEVGCLLTHVPDWLPALIWMSNVSWSVRYVVLHDTTYVKH